MENQQKNQQLLGAWVFVGLITAGLLGFGVTMNATASARQHHHCNEPGCTNDDCPIEHPGFTCRVTDDNICNCIVPPPGA